MKRFSLWSRLAVAAAVAAAIAGALAMLWPRPQAPAFYFQITMRASLPGVARFYYGVGSSANEAQSVRQSVEGGNRDVIYRFAVPQGRHASLRFDPTDQAGNAMVLSNAGIITAAGRLVRAIPPSHIKAASQIEQLLASGAELALTTASPADHPALTLELEPPLILTHSSQPSIRTFLRRFLIFFVPSAAISFLLVSALASKRKHEAGYIRRRFAAWTINSPISFLFATAAAAVILSCYPIVFFGKSFLSPNNHSHALLLYGEMPTVPGYQQATTDNEQGSDLGAAIWYSWPASVVASKAMLKYFELPLWNRYNSCGLPLLGQGQSMLGDPLHFLVLLANGSSGGWDLKYLLAKFLFAACLGFCVLQLTKHVPAAVIIAVTSPFIGFFSYRYSHPAFFSVCYAPFILLCWFKLIDAPKGRHSALWLAMMFLANWMMINSGTVKEAYVLVLAMNLCGCLTLLLAKSVTGKSAKLRQTLVVQVLFVLIATPVWLTFLNALRSSWTAYDAGGAFQLPPGLFVGLFDDIFYRQFNANEQHFNPSANFLVLAGVLWFCLNQRKTDPDRISLGLSITCLLALAFVFGIVPPSFITRIPFLGKIYHVHNTFSCVAIVCLLVLAGFGMKALWDDSRTANFKRIYLFLLAGLAGLLALYLGTTEATQRSTKSLLHVGDHVSKSTFFWGYSFLLVTALVVAPWLFRNVIRADRVRTGQVFSLGLIFFLLHWRHGMHLATPFDSYVMNPQLRINLVADASPAVGLIRDAPGPSRSAGLKNNLAPGYGGTIGVELVDSADPLVNKHYKSLMDAYGVKLIFGSSRRGLIADQLENDLPLFDMLNVRYFLGNAGTKADVIPSLKKIASFDLNVYESSKVWPRAFFADRLAGYDSESDFVALLKEGDGRPFAAIPLSELEQWSDRAALLPDASASAGRLIVPATDYALTNNTTSFKIAAPAKGVVVLTEPYVEGDFQLRVNGKPADYVRVNSAFRGVFLPEAGDYHFSFAYWPRHLTISLWISAFGIILLLLWLRSVLKYSPREA